MQRFAPKLKERMIRTRKNSLLRLKAARYYDLLTHFGTR